MGKKYDPTNKVKKKDAEDTVKTDDTESNGNASAEGQQTEKETEEAKPVETVQNNTEAKADPAKEEATENKEDKKEEPATVSEPAKADTVKEETEKAEDKKEESVKEAEKVTEPAKVAPEKVSESVKEETIEKTEEKEEEPAKGTENVSDSAKENTIHETESPEADTPATAPLSDRKKELDSAMDNYKKASGIERGEEYIGQLQKAIDSCNKLPEALREAAVAKVFRNEFRRNMKESMLASNQREAKGMGGTSHVDSVQNTDRMMSSAYRYFQQNGSIRKGTPYPPYAGLAPDEISERMNKAFEGRPADKQNPTDKKQIEKFSQTLENGFKKYATDSLDNMVMQTNRAEGTSLSGEGIRKYLDFCWKEACKNNPNDLKGQREAFQKDFNTFAEKAFEKMVEQIGPKTDLGIQTRNFNRMMNSVNDFSRANGWTDPNQNYRPFGSLSGEKMAQMQKEAVEALPDSTEKWAKKAVLQQDEKAKEDKKKEQDPLELSDKEKKRQEDKAPKKEGTDVKKDDSVLEGEIGELEQNKGTKESVLPSREDMKKIIDGLPKLENGQTPNEDAIKAMEYCKNLDVKHSERGNLWKLFHSGENKAEEQFLKDAMGAMREKGYRVPDANGKEQWIKAENDPVKEEKENSINSVEETKQINNDIIKASEEPQFKEIAASAEAKVPFKEEDGLDTAHELNNPENPTSAVTKENEALTKDIAKDSSAKA